MHVYWVRFGPLEGKKVTIEIDKVLRPQLHASIQRYCREELDVDIGELQAGFLLDYIVREIGPHIYNQAISDAQAQLIKQVEALPENCFELTGVYWSKKKR